MKRIKYIFLMLAAAAAGGCDMLDLQPVNSMIPKTVEDYQSIIVNAYPTENIYMGLTYMSDDVYVNQATTWSVDSRYSPFFMWADMPCASGSAMEGTIWGAFYKSIFHANTVIDKFKGMTPGAAERDTYETVFGEAYAMRAYSYFYLINMYADVYSEANLDLPGVPMPLTADDVNGYIGNNTRTPLGKVWSQIAEDLETATGYLRGKPAKSEYRFSYDALMAFKARVYLFMGEWDKSIEAASEVIGTKSLFDMNNLQSHITGYGDNRFAFGEGTNSLGFIDTDYRKEVLLFMGGKANGNPFYSWQGATKPSYDIYNLCMRFQPPFTNDDLSTMDIVDYRAYIYCYFIRTDDANYAKAGPTIYNMFRPTGGRSSYYIAIKLSEAYVTRAEAYMRKSSPDKAKAVADLNALLKNRIRSSVWTDLRESDFATNEALLTRILEERRLETALDAGLRWFDLRRLGKPALIHNINNTEYKLTQGDVKYVMQIPESEQIASPNMPTNRENL